MGPMTPTPLVRIHDGLRELFVVRLSADGLAAEVVIDTPSVRMTVRVPELAEVVRNVQPPVPTGGQAPQSPGRTGANGGQPWTCVEIIP